MADTAIPTSEIANQRREHLPRQQPHKALKPIQSFSMGPHPGPTPIARVNSVGGGGGGSSVAQQQSRSLQHKASYLQQRATGTNQENVFKANIPPPPVVPANTEHRHRQHQQTIPTTHSYRNSSGRRMVGPYQLSKTIGAGSMGKVKVAVDTRSNKRVAAKIIPLQQPDAPVYFPNRLDTTTGVAASSTNGGRQSAMQITTNTSLRGPIDPNVEPWRSWLVGLAVESHVDLAAAVNMPVRVQRKLRLLQPRERYTTKDRERRENKDIRIVREVAINRLMFHPHICMLHDVVVHPNHYYIFQELVSGGQMLDYIISHGRLKEKHARKFARQIASAIDYCHHNSIVHRDLKIENILISSNGNIKLIDFGLSNLYSSRSQLSTFCGSLYFAAPELLNAQPYAGPEVDIWSFGVVLYVLVCGKVPFDDQSMPALHAKIKRGHVEYPSWLGPECKHLISRLLVVAHSRRATMGELIRHPWMCKGYVENPLIANYIPTRIPLISPEQIDANVVHEMAQYIGFGFGTEEQIRTGLEAILTEDWYRGWIIDKLAPQLEVIRGQIREQIALSRANKPSQSGSAAETAVAHDTTSPSPAIAVSAGGGNTSTPNPLSLTLLNAADSSSGVTLTNPTAAESSTNTDNAGRSTEPPHLSAADAVRKRSSFWKRSSTFISGGLARTSQKLTHHPSPDTRTAGISGNPASSMADKTQPSQFRVLSGRLFNDSKNSATAGVTSASHSSSSREYNISASSPHSPRMYVDQATGMVGLWKDGKLTPADTDCAAIQRDYHDLVATDPLLSIYFLVKERLEREAGMANRYHQSTTIAPGSQQRYQPAKQGRPESKEAWIKLERASAKPEEALSKAVAATKDNKESSSRDGRRHLLNNASKNREEQADATVTATMDKGKANGKGRNRAASVLLQPNSASVSVNSAHTSPVDQTTAAIEALSSHTPERGSGGLSAQHHQGAHPRSSTAYNPHDSRKKRTSILKRFSAIVKNARPSHKSHGHAVDGSSSSRIVQAEGNESGYMEIKLNNDRQSLPSSTTQEDTKQLDDAKQHLDGSAVARTTVETPTAQARKQRIAAMSESMGARLKSVVSNQKYAELECIDEDRERVSDSEDIAVKEDSSLLEKEKEKEKEKDAGRVETPPPDGSKVVSSDKAKTQRQYLNKSIYPAAQSSSQLSDKSVAALVDSDPKAKTTVAAIADDKNAGLGSTNPDGTPSMFAGTDTDERENIIQSSSVARQGEEETVMQYDYIDSPVSDKAALFNSAKREIDGYEESEEGVGLLDQTPELSYRAAAVASGKPPRSSFDAVKQRARSSSNTVARAINDIVIRDGNVNEHIPGPLNRRVVSSNVHNNKMCSPSHASKSTSPPTFPGESRAQISPGRSSRPHGKTILRHSSTGAINGSSPSNSDKLATHGIAFLLPTGKDGDQEQSLVLQNRPEIPRSHSHAADQRNRGLALPERIAEVSEPPTPLDPRERRHSRIVDSGTVQKDGELILESTSDIVTCDKQGSVVMESSETSGILVNRSNEDRQRMRRQIMDDDENEDEDEDEDGVDFADDLVQSMSNNHRADEYLKPVFLKGLFSVSTTSTRSPTEIRANLLRVLSQMPLRFNEGRGYFTCSMMITTAGPDNLQEGGLDGSSYSRIIKPKKSIRLPGVVDRKVSFRRRVKHSDEAVQSLAPSNSDKTGAIRTNNMSSNEDNLSGSHNIIEVEASSKAIATSKNNSICFQIFLVRMPLLGLYGLQFRRVSGPAWKYKDICSDILKRLKL